MNPLDRDQAYYVQTALEAYEKANDEPCECDKANIGGHCPRCGLIELARRIGQKLVGDYEQH